MTKPRSRLPIASYSFGFANVGTMSQSGRFGFPNIQTLITISVVFWILMIQFILRIEFKTYDFLIGLTCLLGILIAVISSKGEQ